MSAWRSTLQRFFRFMGARWLTPVLLGSGLLVFLLSLVLQAEKSVQVAAGIELSFGGAELTRLMATSPLVWSYFALLVLHALCRWLSALVKDRESPALELAEKNRILAEAWRYGIVLGGGDWKSIADCELGRGAAVSAGEGRAVYARRPTRMPLRLFQLGLIVLAAGLVLSTALRQSGTLEIGEGQVLPAGTTATISRYDWRFPTSGTIPVAIEAIRLDQGAVDLGLNARLQPRSGPLLRWPISARLSYLDRGKEHEFVARTFPPALANGYIVSLTGVGLGPRVVVERSGRTVIDTYAQLNIVPGYSTEASVAIDSLPYTLDFKLLPNPQANVLDSPYRLRLIDERSGEGVVASQTVGPYAKSLVYDGWRISVPETRTWVALSVTRDPAMLLVVLGIIMASVGFLAWLVVLAIGHERWMLVETHDDRADRLYVGLDASWAARPRARKRFESLLRALGG